MIGRLKFEIDSLVNEMLDQIPQDIIINGTVLDPAFGGGQFLREVERRKRAAGKTDAEIRATVFGIEANQLRVAYVVNKYKLAGTYSVGDFLNTEMNMKFDVVIGNPPYQGTNTFGSNQPKSHNLWSKFVIKAIDELVVDDGVVAMITPDSWMSPSSDVLAKFKGNSLIWVNTNVSKHFKEGSSFTGWALAKNKNTKNVIIDGLSVIVDDLNYLPRNFANTFPIHKKVMGVTNEKLPVLGDTTCHSDYKQKKLSATKDSNYKYKAFHTNAQTKFSNVKSKDYSNSKIVWTTSGYFKPFYSEKNLCTTEVCQYVLVDNEDEATKILSYLDSKLYKFIINTGKWSGFLNGKVLASLPKLPLDTWTNASLYAYFGLTQEEIDYVEANVK